MPPLTAKPPHRLAFLVNCVRVGASHPRMNSKTSKRANHCKRQHAPQRPWLDHGPFPEAESEPDESWHSEHLDALLDEDREIDLEDFLDFFD